MRTVLMLLTSGLLAAPTKPAVKVPKAPVVVHHAGPLPMLPSIGAVKIDVRADAVLVQQDILLPKGDYKRGAISVYTALGGPGYPRAADAELLLVENGSLSVAQDAVGEKLTTETAPHASPQAHTLLGPSNMAGISVTLAEAALVRAFEPGNMANLRLRFVYALPPAEADGFRTVLLRVGSSEREPLTLGTIQVEGVEAARAAFCGPNSDPTALSVWNAKARYASTAPTIAPVLAVRHKDDTLCVSFKVKA
jgi:hypothetical protein